MKFDRKKILVMGGSFNPPTSAHKKILQAAVTELNADAGIFVPSSDAYVRRKMRKSRFPKAVLSEQQRLEMLAAMCQDDKRLQVDDCEFQDDGRGHTYETMVKLKEKNQNATLYFLVGGDKLNIITRWRNHEVFFEQFKFAVMKREGMNPEEQIENNPRLLRNKNVFYIVSEPNGIEGISSSVLREKLFAGDESASELVTEEVWKLLLEAGWFKREIRSFREKYHFLSNFYETSIEYKGLLYTNAEAAFQAQKCMTEKEKVLFTEYSASRAKRQGRLVKLRPDWEDVKLSLMEEIVRAKFVQNPEIRKLLLETADCELIEGNTWHDVFWGVDVRTEEGENHLGKILMKIRREFLNEQ